MTELWIFAIICLATAAAWKAWTAGPRQAVGLVSVLSLAVPIWVAAARQGISVTAAFAPQVSPFEPFLDERRFGADFGFRLTLIDGYPDAPGSRLGHAL